MVSAVPTPSRIEFPVISTVRFGDTVLITAPTPNRARPEVRQRVRPYRSVSSRRGDHQCAHDQQEQGDGDLHTEPPHCPG
jgi:hypothetical protein